MPASADSFVQCMHLKASAPTDFTKLALPHIQLERNRASWPCEVSGSEKEVQVSNSRNGGTGWPTDVELTHRDMVCPVTAIHGGRGSLNRHTHPEYGCRHHLHISLTLGPRCSRGPCVHGRTVPHRTECSGQEPTAGKELCASPRSGSAHPVIQTRTAYLPSTDEPPSVNE